MLQRAETVVSATESDIFLSLLRAVLSGIDRDTCLTAITLISPIIALIGGAKAVQEWLFFGLGVPAQPDPGETPALSGC